MKTYPILAAVLLFWISANSQNTNNPSANSSVSTTNNEIKTLRDSASYGVGCFIVNFNQQQGITDIKSAMVSRAINDMQGQKPLLIKTEETEIVIGKYQKFLVDNQQATDKMTLKNNPDPKVFLKNLADSASYAIGMFTMNIYQQHDISNINADAAARAINDLQTKKPQLLTDQQINQAIMAYHQTFIMEKVKPNIEAGNKVLTENKSRPGVTTTASGLQYEIITKGNGQIPVSGDTIISNYIGKLVNGNEFDNSYKRGAPLTIGVDGVIDGWTEALKLMPVGSKWRIWIPYDLGYGLNNIPGIPGGSLLIFEMELLGIKGK